MSTDDYNQEMEERARLIAEINAAKAELAMQIELNRQLRVDLQVSQAAAIESIKYSKALAASFIPLMNGVAEEVDDVKNILDEVKVAVQDLSKRYTSIKNVSTATKNLTQCDDIYQRKFRLYEKFRKVCLGYVIGIDSNIINSETLRTTLEKNYLANSDYWIAHCIMATMLWVNDEKDASDRALNKAMEIDPKRSTIFFLLVNLRFGRTEAAKKWYNLNMLDNWPCRNCWNYDDNDYPCCKERKLCTSYYSMDFVNCVYAYVWLILDIVNIETKEGSRKIRTTSL